MSPGPTTEVANCSFARTGVEFDRQVYDLERTTKLNRIMPPAAGLEQKTTPKNAGNPMLLPKRRRARQVADDQGAVPGVLDRVPASWAAIRRRRANLVDLVAQPQHLPGS